VERKRDKKAREKEERQEFVQIWEEEEDENRAIEERRQKM